MTEARCDQCDKDFITHTNSRTCPDCSGPSREEVLKDLDECVLNAESVLRDLDWLKGRNGYHFEITATTNALNGLLRQLKKDRENVNDAT